MAKTFYVIDKEKITVTAQHDSKQLCVDHINNSVDLFGIDPRTRDIAEGAQQRDAMLKALKENRNRD